MSRFITLEIISNGVVVTNSQNGGGGPMPITSEEFKSYHPDNLIGAAITDMVADFRSKNSNDN